MSRFVLTAQLQLQAPNNVAQVVRQIQSQLNNVNVNVNVQGAARAQRQLQQVTAQTTAATTAADRMGRAFAVSIRRFAAFSIATRAVSLFTSTLSSAIQTAIDFEREMVKVSQVTGDSMEKLRGLSKTITGLSTGLGVASNSLLEASTLLLQAGISAKDTEVALKTLAKAALAPNFDSLSETTEGAIAILAQFGEGVGALEKQLGSINAVAGAFAVEASDLMDVIRRTGGVFKSSGGSLNELIALFTSVRATTRESAESIGTGLRTIFTRIQRPKTIEFLKQFGVELVDMEGKFVGPYEAVKRLSSALAGLGERDITFIKIAEELGGFRQIGKVLPLLQQFTTAQNALNVANKAGSSLTNDAATAQQALAIRILKVKEEFLALVRGMTETKTFQIMANTALSLASALIKIADSIKPLLPMLTALMAFKMVKGLGGFLGGMGRGMASGRTFSTGGKVHHFARGGIVPGTGNRDTVPAMLQPGEFVIKKSSVNSIGAGNLAAMNENRFAAGGVVNTKRNFYGSVGPDGRSLVGRTKGFTLQEALNAGFSRAQLSGAFGKQAVEQATGVTSAQAQAMLGRKKGEDPNKVISGARLSTRYGVSFLEGALGGNLSATINQVRKSGNATGVAALEQAIAKDGRRVLSGARIESPNASVAFLQPNAKEIFDDEIMGGLPKLFDEATNKFGAPLKPGKVGINELVSNSAVQAIKGYFFEGFARRVSQNLIADSMQDKTDPIFDFTGAGNIGDLKRMFGGKFVDPNEFKVAPTTDNIANAISKAISLRGTAGLQFFASGGGVGTDTVPALLTPGEFVVNRSAAQNIGYGNLNRMNKVGKYAKGGVVQRFAKGSTGAGVQPKGDFIAQKFVNFSGLEGAIVKSMVALDKLTIGGYGKLTTVMSSLISKVTGLESISGRSQKQLVFLNSVLPNFSQVLQENQKATKRSVITQSIVVEEMYKEIKSLQQSGATQLTLRQAAQTYINALQQQTGMLQKGSPVTPVTKPIITGGGGGGGAGGGGGGGAGGGGGGGVSSPTTKKSPNTRPPTSGGGGMAGMVQDNKMMAMAMATSLVQGFLPAIDENSGALLRLSHSFLGLVTTIASVGFALEAFGVQLKAKGIMDFFTGKGLPTKGISKAFNSFTGNSSFGRVFRAATQGTVRGGSLAGKSAAQTAITRTGIGSFGGKSATMLGQAAGKIGPAINSIAKMAGPALGVGLAFTGLTAMIDSYTNYQGKLNKAIADGNIDKAKENAASLAASDAANSIGTAMIATGALFGPFGLAIGAASAAVIKLGTEFGLIDPAMLIDFMSIFGGPTYDSVVKLAAAQAGAVKTQKALEQAQKTATNAMQDFENGSISASEALAKIRSSTDEANKQEKRASEFATSNLENRSEIGSGAILRNLGAYLGGGLFGMETAATRNERLGKEGADQIRQAAKFQGEAFQMETGARTASIRSGFARGKSKEEITKEALGGRIERMRELSQTASRLEAAGDTEGAKAANEAFQQVAEEVRTTKREIENLEKEVARAKAAFDAMNLGLRGASATATAMSASMNKFAAGLEVGGNTFVANTEFLSQAMSGAAQAMNPAEIKSAVSDVSQNLSQMGVSGTAVKKFEDNTNGFIQAQQNYNKAFEKIKADIKARRESGKGGGDTPEEIKKAFADELTAGLGDEAKKNLTAVIENIALSQEEVDKLLAGDLSVFGDKLTEAGQKQFEEIMKIAQERQKAEQVVIGLIQKRADAERNLATAQKEAVDLYMEGRDVQAKYGGTAVSYQEKRGAILAKANAGATNAGLSAMRTGSIAELRNRNTQMMAGFGAIEQKRRVEGGMAGTAGVKADQTQQNLQQAQKDQVQTIRDLIKLEEEELKIIQEKNKMEKDSLEALIGGDVEKFFEQQAAVGAQAAIAAGDTNAANMFGGKAVGMAFQDIQRQQEAGVQTMFGRQLGGPGGLAEQAAGAALASRGVMDPRMAQRLAGTTAAEEASKARLRELGGMLGETGAVGAAMAEMQVQTANINVANAELKLSEIEARGKQAAEGMYRGGMVYANRGMFVPRGTDTVPAMLTPGEFVVNRNAVNTGNNLQLLKAINSGGVSAGFARGGKVGYYNNGGQVQYKMLGGLMERASKAIGIDPQMITNLGNIFNTFVNGFNESIKNLQNTKLQVKMDSVNVNVNLNGTSMLTQITEEARKSIIDQVVTTLKSQYGVGSNGKLQENNSNLPRPGG